MTVLRRRLLVVFSLQLQLTHIVIYIWAYIYIIIYIIIYIYINAPTSRMVRHFLFINYYYIYIRHWL